MDLEKYQTTIDRFAKERNWDQYHTPKNLVMALAGEAGELLDLFQWLTPEESTSSEISDQNLILAREEMADIMIFLLRLADKLEIDLEKAVETKLAINAKKYPVELAKDNATKYNRRDK